MGRKLFRKGEGLEGVNLKLKESFQMFFLKFWREVIFFKFEKNKFDLEHLIQPNMRLDNIFQKIFFFIPNTLLKVETKGYGWHYLRKIVGGISHPISVFSVLIFIIHSIATHPSQYAHLLNMHLWTWKFLLTNTQSH